MSSRVGRRASTTSYILRSPSSHPAPHSMCSDTSMDMSGASSSVLTHTSPGRFLVKTVSEPAVMPNSPYFRQSESAPARLSQPVHAAHAMPSPLAIPPRANSAISRAIPDPQVDEMDGCHMSREDDLLEHPNVIVHDPAIVEQMDTRGISWGVQYAIAAGVGSSQWSWAEVTNEKLDRMVGHCATVLPQLASIIKGSSNPAPVRMADELLG